MKRWVNKNKNIKNYYPVRLAQVISIISLFCTSLAADETSPDNSALHTEGSAPIGSPIAGSVDVATPGTVGKAMIDLLRVLDEETALATKTKMNIDFVPGMVSVLHAKDLLATGMSTVFDALALIPGVELSMTHDGQYQVIVRGVGKTFSSGKVKILLNGVPFNAALNASALPLMLPLDLVSRIEVIRGPGSVIYGEYASVGVIDIITSLTNNLAFIRRNDIQNTIIGGHVSAIRLNKDTQLNLSFSQQWIKGGTVKSGEDILASSPLASINTLSNSPGPIDSEERNRAVLMDIEYLDYSILWQYLERGFGDYFGLANALPSYSDKIIRTSSMHNFQISKPWSISNQININSKIGWFNFEIDSEQHQLYPAGFRDKDTDIFVDGVLGAPNYKEDKYSLGFELDYTGILQHAILLGLDYSQTKQGATYAHRNYEYVNSEINLVENRHYTGDQSWLGEGLERSVISLYVQDQYALTNKWNITAGLRIDKYDDIGDDLTPRLAAVYHISDSKTLKIQYAQSFRPPTFLELYARNNAIVVGNPDLDSERLESYEIGYVFNEGITVGRLTYFYYTLENLISSDIEKQMYANIGEVEARGLEFEYQRKISQISKLNFTLSFTDTKINGTQIFGVAKSTGNIGWVLQPLPNFTFVAQYRFVGDRQRESGDGRSSLEGYNTVDLTASLYNQYYKGLTFSASVKNLFNSDVRYPSFIVEKPPGSTGTVPVPRPGYFQDYPQAGRQISINLSYEF